MSNKFRVGLSILATLAIIGCGGGGSSSDSNATKDDKQKEEQQEDTQKDTNNTEEFVINKTFDNPKYEPRSATIQIGSAYVNKYDKIQTELNKHKDNQNAFNIVFDLYIDELLYVSKPVDDVSSYAPRGDMKSKTFDVKNGGIDYSSYILEGDFSGDGLIDFKDVELLKKEFYKNVKSSTFDTKYDLNKDGKLDTKDMITLTSRLLTNIEYFSFYDVNGKKLNIPTRKYSDPKNVSYSGSETKIMVVAKDMNKASSYSDTLSDINEVWYKQEVATAKTRSADFSPENYLSDEFFDNLVKDTEPTEKKFGDKQSIINYINSSIKEFSQVTEPYVIGFAFSVKLRSSINGMSFINLNTSANAIEEVKERLAEKHFKDARLGLRAKVFRDINQATIHIGKVFDAKHNEVKVLRTSMKFSQQIGKKRITKIVILHVAGVTSFSKNETIKAKVKEQHGGQAKGTLLLKRRGPLPKKKTFTKEGVDNFVFPNAAFGAYNIEFKNECQCDVDITPTKKDIIFDSDKDLKIYITQMQKPISIRLVYKDKKGKPIKNKKVEISETNRCRDKDHKMKFDTKTTDDDGVVNFPSGFTSGEFTIDGKKYNFCENTVKNMNGANLWDISYDFKGRITDFKKTYTNVIIHGADEKMNPAPQVGTNIAPKLPYSDTKSIEGLGPVTKSVLGADPTWGFTMEYFKNAINVQGMYNIPSDTYCFESEDLIDAMNPSELVKDNTAIGCAEPPRICFKVGFGAGDCQTVFPSDYNGIVTALSEEQKKKLKNHESFTFVDSGYWYFNEEFGKSYLKVEFKAK